MLLYLKSACDKTRFPSLCIYIFMFPRWVGLQSVVVFQGKKSRFKEKKKKKSIQALPVQFSVSGENAFDEVVQDFHPTVS